MYTQTLTSRKKQTVEVFEIDDLIRTGAKVKTTLLHLVLTPQVRSLMLSIFAMTFLATFWMAGDSFKLGWEHRKLKP
jgi:hypothetical protein